MRCFAVFLLAGFGVSAQDPVAVEKAATKFVPGVVWQRGSVLSGNFTCRGRQERAILGTNASESVIAVFVNGLSARPEVLRYSAKGRDPKLVELTIEDLDYDPQEIFGEDYRDLIRSKTCKGLNLSDGMTDSAHIFWNRKRKRFEDWVL